MSNTKILKWVTGGLEALLGIPVLGGIIIMSFLWIPLVIMLALHIVTLIITKKEGGETTTGSILGIVTSCIGFIPIVGMIMHIITAVILMLEASKPDVHKESMFNEEF
ncbi:hypothetical protein MKZ20_06605 [Psychrobacillus sp. FSL K6-2684]|uniref:DUF4190 domain-containing protein n=1 Tax=Psychrobacillus faecigallinarum TaxID=2762235 RepID=A0ABR8R4Q1_9BACI|nr:MULTISPECIES: hypothetical protein [Psychrobacillus]MBD7942767.1 hypothetical protein [Psychrobacillus faecigallinarum]QEY20243.1 hypothetical protein D0S48_05825 [Psychrobacillus sp. AK 1817]